MILTWTEQSLLESYLMDYNSMQSKLTLLRSQLHGAEALVCYSGNFISIDLLWLTITFLHYAMLLSTLSSWSRLIWLWVLLGVPSARHFSKWTAHHQHCCVGGILHFCSRRLCGSNFCKLNINFILLFIPSLCLFVSIYTKYSALMYGALTLPWCFTLFVIREWIWKMGLAKTRASLFGLSPRPRLSWWCCQLFWPSYTLSMLRSSLAGLTISHKQKSSDYKLE